jgi:hypothetical protein
MSLFIGYLSLGIAFVILVSILLWNGFGPRSFRVSLVMVPLVIWYSMALFYVPSHLLGWPSNHKIPEKFLVISFWVHEPMKGQQGGIYLWGREWDGKKPERNLTSPKQAFRYIPELMTPRAFRVDYSRALHKKLMKQREEVEQVAGGIMMIERRKKRIVEQEGDEQIGPEDFMEFTILNPAETPTK